MRSVEVAAGAIIIAIITGTIGLGVYFGEYKPSTIDHEYIKEECYIVNNTVLKQPCHINYCDYTVNITVRYIGKVEVVNGTFSVFVTTTETGAQEKMKTHYAIGSKIGCYYSENIKYPLRITPRNLGDSSMFALSMFAFMIMGFAGVVFISVIIAYFFF